MREQNISLKVNYIFKKKKKTASNDALQISHHSYRASPSAGGMKRKEEREEEGNWCLIKGKTFTHCRFLFGGKGKRGEKL